MNQEFFEPKETKRYEAIKDIQENLARLLYKSEIKQIIRQRKETPEENELKLMRESANERAREVSADILDIAMDIDEKVNTLLKDPRVLKGYEYNGKWFSPRDGRGFSRVLDGEYSLTTLRDNLRAYFNSSGTNAEITASIIETSKRLLQEAEAVLKNWKESKKISVVNPEIIEEATEQHRVYEKEKREAEETENEPPPPLADYEKEYEREMEEFFKNQGKK